MTKVAPIDLGLVLTYFGQLERKGVHYGLGAKAGIRKSNPLVVSWASKNDESPLAAPPELFTQLDCSGLAQLLMFQGTKGQAVRVARFPDGSQNQRGWCEEQNKLGFIKKVNYRDAARYMTDTRLFIHFIKPFTNGCGKVGHVWFTLNADDDADAETIESYGGHGVGNRPWNARTLLREVYSSYELPVLKSK